MKTSDQDIKSPEKACYIIIFFYRGLTNIVCLCKKIWCSFTCWLLLHPLIITNFNHTPNLSQQNTAFWRIVTTAQDHSTIISEPKKVGLYALQCSIKQVAAISTSKGAEESFFDSNNKHSSWTHSWSQTPAFRKFMISFPMNLPFYFL